MTYTSEQARELGHSLGYNAANYAANVSGQDPDTLAPDDVRPLGMSELERMYFDDGFANSIDAYAYDEWASDNL